MDKEKLKRLIDKHLPDTVEVSDAEQNKVDASLGLRPITIRLQNDLINDLKKFAKEDGQKYQAFARQILTRAIKELKEKDKSA